ncbi:hybrid sensor histidine kinase/response regulator [Neptunomonas japonica]|uniref:hybrid sensor histidine kinase/response regulator n=1 Tax=Neptunomonas japonica TaxID=417574 RepID=UPI0006871808|nr:hybrid sensor histidine kinase/response regulator [Neptunomonas japonica]
MKSFKDLPPNLRRYSKEHPLGYKVMLYVCGCSFLFILLSTALQLTLDYRREFKAIDQQVELIRSSYLASLAKSVWDIDQAQIKLQLKGIENLPDVAFISLDNINSDSIHLPTQNTNKNIQQIQSHQFKLVYFHNKQQRSLGTLAVSFNLKAVYARIWKRGFGILLNQTLLVLLIVLVIIVIFQRQITRHLEAMANYSREIGSGQLENSLQLNRTSPKNSDELDQLVTALNEMRLSIRKEISRREQEQEELRYNRDQLQAMVERRTESLQKAKEAAEEASNAKSRFLSTMSHEIRTPMNGMMGMIQLLKSSELNDEQHSHICVLHDATNALLETFNNVLEYGRLVEGAYSVSSTRFSLHNLLHNLTALLSPEANRKQLTLTVTVAENIGDYFLSEENSLRQILTNLLANAIKFTDQGSVELHVSCLEDTPEHQTLRFAISDSGIGIAPNLQEHIFDRFTQADETITRRFGGTGLGLAICKELAEHLGGNLGLESRPGQGSTFWLELTLQCTQAEAKKPKHLNADVYTPSAQHILLVEDVEINQQVILGLLAGHKVTIADDGVKALAMGREQVFDLILMDMHLPGLSGLEVSRRLNHDPDCINYKTRIIALTASVRPEDIHSYLEAGICSVIAKPVDKEQLLQAIAGHQPSDEYNTISSKYNDTDKPILDSAVVSVHQQMLGAEKLATLMKGFCKVLNETWPVLQQSIFAQDYYECSQQAHKLAGACDTMGFSRASQLLRSLEETADLGEEINSTFIDELQDVITSTQALAKEWT